MRKTFNTFVLTMLISVLFTNFIIINTLAEPWPEVTIDAEPQANVNVSPGSGCLTNVSGIITCNSTSYEDVIVKLSLDLDGCGGTISPVVMTFEGIGSHTKDFSIMISVKMRTSSYETPKATIYGIWTQGALTGEITPFTIHVHIISFSKLSMEWDGPETVYSGETTSFPIRINNTGNVNDIYRLEIINREELEKDSVKVGAIDDIAIEEGEYLEIGIPVRTYSDTPLKVHKLNIVTTSSETEAPARYEFTFYLRVKPGIIQILTSPLSIILVIILIIIGFVVYEKKRKPKPPNPR